MAGRIARTIVALVLAQAAAVGAAGWARAATGPAPIPADVVAFAQGRGLAVVQALLADEPNDVANGKGDTSARPTVARSSAALRATQLHEVFGFSPGFLAGQAIGDPVTSAKQWTAGVFRDGQPLGTMTVWKPEGGPPEVARLDGDAELAAALTGLRDDDLFVLDERTAECFAVRGDIVRPLNQRARVELANAAPLSQLRPVVAARIRAQVEASQGGDATVGGGGPVAGGGRQLDDRWFLGGVLLAAMGGVAGGLALRRNRVQAAREGS